MHELQLNFLRFKYLELILPYDLLTNPQSLVSILLIPLSTHDLDFLNHFLAKLPPILVITRVKLLLLHFDQAFGYSVQDSLTIEVLLVQHFIHFIASKFDFA